MSLIGKTKLKILKQLDRGPNHGYQLHKDVGVSTPVVYRHLSDFEEAGMVESNRVDGDNRDKTEYRLTENGEKLLALLTDD